MTYDESLVLRKTLNKLLDKRLIRAGSSLARAPVLFARKKGGLEFYVDYQGLNNIIRKDHYPLPWIKETLSNISKVKYFMKLDIITAFHKIRIAKG